MYSGIQYIGDNSGSGKTGESLLIQFLRALLELNFMLSLMTGTQSRSMPRETFWQHIVQKHYLNGGKEK